MNLALKAEKCTKEWTTGDPRSEEAIKDYHHIRKVRRNNRGLKQLITDAFALATTTLAAILKVKTLDIKIHAELLKHYTRSDIVKLYTNLLHANNIAAENAAISAHNTPLVKEDIFSPADIFSTDTKECHAKALGNADLYKSFVEYANGRQRNVTERIVIHTVVSVLAGHAALIGALHLLGIYIAEAPNTYKTYQCIMENRTIQILGGIQAYRLEPKLADYKIKNIVKRVVEIEKQIAERLFRDQKCELLYLKELPLKKNVWRARRTLKNCMVLLVPAMATNKTKQQTTITTKLLAKTQ